jgi:hypothetical protein
VAAGARVRLLVYCLTVTGKDFFLFIVFFIRTNSVRFGFTGLNSTKPKPN